MSSNAAAVTPPTAYFCAPLRNSRRLIPPCTYPSNRLSSSCGKSDAFLRSTWVPPLVIEPARSDIIRTEDGDQLCRSLVNLRLPFQVLRKPVAPCQDQGPLCLRLMPLTNRKQGCIPTALELRGDPGGCVSHRQVLLRGPLPSALYRRKLLSIHPAL